MADGQCEEDNAEVAVMVVCTDDVLYMQSVPSWRQLPGTADQSVGLLRQYRPVTERQARYGCSPLFHSPI